jgi:nitrile hydratase alpha subunit
MNVNTSSNRWSDVIAKAWADADYQSRLVADPVKVLHEEGFKIPHGTSISLVVDSGKHLTLVIPPKPDAGVLDSNDADCCTGGCFCTWTL